MDSRPPHHLGALVRKIVGAWDRSTHLESEPLCGEFVLVKQAAESVAPADTALVVAPRCRERLEESGAARGHGAADAFRSA
jgi:hypothetical protein